MTRIERLTNISEKECKVSRIKRILSPISNLGSKSPSCHHFLKFGVSGHNSINTAGHNSGHNYYFALFTTTTYFTHKIEYVEQLKSKKFIVQSENRKLQY